MRYIELNVFGVFISPMAMMLPAAWVIMILLRRGLDFVRLWRFVWHPALATLALYIIVLSAIVAAVGS
jgi:hypothetical protein